MIELGKTNQIISPWVTLVAHSVINNMGDQVVYHSIKQADYVAVLAITSDGKIPLVKQFRPALGQYTLELPGGLLESDESPESCARRELLEETGLVVTEGKLELMRILKPDTGRLENRLWCFFAYDVTTSEGWSPEKGIAHKLVNKEELLQASISGEFDHALHLAVLAIALIKGSL